MMVHITANSIYAITTHYWKEQEQDEWSFPLLPKKPKFHEVGACMVFFSSSGT